MARSVKQTAKAPLSAHRTLVGRTARGATTPPEGRAGAVGANGDSVGSPSPQSDWPIYAELVAELGDPTA